MEDPWAQPLTWIDSEGNELVHEGIVSEYLWVHPLVAGECDECDQLANGQVESHVSGWTIVDPGFDYVARNEVGQVVREGQPRLYTFTLQGEDLVRIDIDSLSVDFLELDTDSWITLAQGKLSSSQDGGYTYTITVEKSGRYVLLAKEAND